MLDCDFCKYTTGARQAQKAFLALQTNTIGGSPNQHQATQSGMDVSKMNSFNYVAR